MARSGQIREKKGDKLIKVRLSQHPVETKSRIHLLDSILEFVTVALPNNSMYGEIWASYSRQRSIFLLLQETDPFSLGSSLSKIAICKTLWCALHCIASWQDGFIARTVSKRVLLQFDSKSFQFPLVVLLRFRKLILNILCSFLLEERIWYTA